ncbi:hypothetical protein Atai01_53470 [Amycolatopsis taiwanensis]|uniref:Uncharacterized protein n=2 Tax=Amycolatopsis taiwanensis TaxID=342230 RepID=A0A9W6R4Z6_9PSEU|nr:hypothetical protein Atai01_53470 [Amycolatopsis taiwanensis]
MSRSNRKNHTAAATVPQDEPTAEDKVRAALAGKPGSTTAELAIAAGVGRSTAAKILARWDRDGAALRTAGDGPRKPDTWTLALPIDDATARDSNDTKPDTKGSPGSDEPSGHAPGTDETATTEESKSTGEAAEDGSYSAAGVTTAEEILAAEGPETISDTGNANDTADASAPSVNDNFATGADSGNGSGSPDAAATEPTDGGSEADASSTTAAAGAQFPDGTLMDKNRLPKGGLRALVEQYLTEHPGESFGPAKIGKDLGRSGGAVNNALEKLVADGYAIKTCEAPKRFAINPDKTDVPATTTDSTE